MRLAAITPIRVSENELRRRQRRYDRLAPPQLTISLRNLEGADAPRSLEDAADIARSEKLMAQAVTTLDQADYDGVFPDCVLDPAVERLAGAGDLPVFGILRLTAGFLAGVGSRFGAVTRNPAIGVELAERLKAYGLDRDFVGLSVLDLGFDAIADDMQWNAALAVAVADLGVGGATAVINGCSAVDVGVAPPPVVVDPTALALRLLAAGAAAISPART